MRKLIALLLCIGFAKLSLSQTTTLRGNIADTSEKKPLPFGVVSLLQKDSILYRFTRSDKSGNFTLDNLKPGAYRLLITYPKFADYADDITVKEGENSLPAISLTKQSQLLQTVVVRSAGAVRIKGDTTEFVADSFRVREGATVEELLKKLPGFTVNAKGEITAQGQRVQKVLVDGEEFFGDDPTMATKNIGAKAVDKVQLFDNKSETEQLTGMSGGQQQGKTVNIKLKEDQKKGGFGKYSVASDFDRYHDANALYNKFKGKKKVSLYGVKSNTSTGSLNWNERRQLGIENDFEFDELSGGFFFDGGGEDDGFSPWNFRGLPDAYAAGALFSNKWKNDQQNVNVSYRYNRLGMQNLATTLTQNILADTILYTNSYSRQRSLNQQHAGNGKWEWKPDSLTTIKLTTALTHRNTTSNYLTNTESLREVKGSTANPLNDGDRLNQSDVTRLDADNQLQYKRLFKKAGRQLQARIRFRYLEDDLNGLLQFTNRFYRANQPDSIEVADQQKENYNKSTTLGGKITFVEPLSQRWSLIADYGYNRNSAVSYRNTFDKSGSGKYDVRNNRFSNNFDMEASGHSGSLISRYKYKKLQFGVGSGVATNQFNLLNLDNNRKYTFNFFNITPQANLGYEFRPNMRGGFYYNGRTIQPGIEQLQPLQNNTDPLNIVVGNPDLDVAFQHQINGYFNFYKVLKQTGLYSWFSYNSTQDAISTSTSIDGFGRRITQAVNVDGNSNWYIGGGWNKGEGEKVLQYSAEMNASGAVYNNIINGFANRTQSLNFSFGVGLRYEVDQKWSLNVRPRLGTSQSVSSLNKAAKTSYLTYGGESQGFVMLPGKLELRSEIEFDLRQRIAAFAANPNVYFWKAELSRKVFKNKSGTIYLIAHDILNSYRGINRIINSNIITEERYQRVGQYFQLKLEWGFNNMGGGE